MKFILGKKLGMTQIFRNDGSVVPVTKIEAGPCVITQVKTQEKDGVASVQIGFGKRALFRLNKAEQGHLKGLPATNYKRDFRVEPNSSLKFGDLFTAGVFEIGEKVKVVGTSKGRGFQGVVKRHGFSGSPASHGHKDQLRMPGSIGSTGPQRVFKGTRMGGHMGDSQVTVSNLEIVGINEEKNELLIKGAVPGARGGLLSIFTEKGNIKPAKNLLEETVKEEKVEIKPEVETVANNVADVNTVINETEEGKEPVSGEAK